jgi:hypothetical protein
MQLEKTKKNLKTKSFFGRKLKLMISSIQEVKIAVEMENKWNDLRTDWLGKEVTRKVVMEKTFVKDHFFEFDRCTWNDIMDKNIILLSKEKIINLYKSEKRKSRTEEINLDLKSLELIKIVREV